MSKNIFIKRTICFLVFMFAVSSIAVISVKAQEVKRIVQGTSWKDVKAELYECRRNQGILTIKILLKNRSSELISGGSFLKENRIDYNYVFLLDPKSFAKYGVKKDTEGKYLQGLLNQRRDGGWTYRPKDPQKSGWNFLPHRQRFLPLIFRLPAFSLLKILTLLVRGEV